MNNIKNSPLLYLYEGLELFPNSPVLITETRSWTWAEFSEDVFATASFLSEQGIKPGQRIATVTSDNPESFILMFAIWTLACVQGPINTSLQANQKEALLNKLEPHHIILGKSEEVQFGKLPYPSVKIPPNIREYDSGIKYKIPRPDDYAIIMFTSGTTGIPKGVLNTHSALAMNTTLTAEALKITHTDRILINTPAYYTSAICHFLTMLSKGGSLVSRQGFLFSEQFTELTNKYECAGFGGAPSHFGRIFENISNSKVELKMPRFMMSSGDHLPVHLINKALTAFPELEIYCFYGLSEVAGRFCYLPPEKLFDKKGSVGGPLPGMKFTICDEGTLDPVNPGVLGEIYADGTMLTKTYFKDELASRELNTPFGFKTGDFGYLDDEGFLYLKGRKDDIFKCGGEKVSALMVQHTIMSIDEFDDCAVIPIEDEILMKRPVVFYVPKIDREIKKLLILRKLKKLLPPSHLPSKFIRVEKIPRTGSGKVIRDKLIKMVQSDVV